MRLLGYSLVAMYCGVVLALTLHAAFWWLAAAGLGAMAVGVGAWAVGVLSGRIDTDPLGR